MLVICEKLWSSMRWYCHFNHRNNDNDLCEYRVRVSLQFVKLLSTTQFFTHHLDMNDALQKKQPFLFMKPT